MKSNLAVLVPAVTSHDAKSVVQTVVQACEEAKGKDIVTLDVKKISDVADYFVVVSGRSDRQVQGIINRILDSLPTNIQPLAIEGIEDGQWVLLDLGDVVIHAFYEPMREHYDIEGLWSRGKRVQILASSAA